ncbi:50S ribosomal protein L14 [Candidatus Woesearchaeota archaeon]|nr:50S ribosomal protein L14 [Candidatus Woesearchaeota archaeon]
MKSLRSRIIKGIGRRAEVDSCDNSGAKKLIIVSVKGSKTVHGRNPSAGVGDLVLASVVKGTQEMRKQVVPCVIVRQRKEYRRPDGTRIKFEDNALVVLKDEKGNPKGTLIKGPVAKEVSYRWPSIAKLARIVV